MPIYGPELFPNGGFDTDITGWTKAANLGAEWDAGRLKVTLLPGGGLGTQVTCPQFPLPAGTGRVFELAFDTETTHPHQRLTMTFYDGAITAGSTVYQADTPASGHYSYQFMVPDSAKAASIGLGPFAMSRPPDGTAAHYDNVSVRQITVTIPEPPVQPNPARPASTDAREEITAALVAAGLPAHPYVPKTVSLPSVIVIPDDPYLIPNRLGSQLSMEAAFIVACLANGNDTEAAVAVCEALAESVVVSLPDGVTATRVGRPSLDSLGAQGSVYVSEVTVRAQLQAPVTAPAVPPSPAPRRRSSTTKPNP